MSYTAKDLLAAGVPPDKHIPKMLSRADTFEGGDLMAFVADLMPRAKVGLKPPRPVRVLAEAENDDERANLDAVEASMIEMARTPVVKVALALPDAFPTGSKGTITVGGVAASEAIHPGMDSSDICCSVAISVFEDAAPADVMDRMAAATHFGPGGRKDMEMPEGLGQRIAANRFTARHLDIAGHHFGTQGDGNHFAYVGHLESDGRVALVTHHGLRGFGAKLYKDAIKLAQRQTRVVLPETLKVKAGIDADTRDGEDYWEALQIVRAWTKANHLALQDALGFKVADRFWNEHNFVFRKSEGLFCHAKGATPAFDGWAEDATDLTLISLNMAEPVLITRGRDNPRALGFAPHGAGRNYSRGEHMRRGIADLAAETRDIDARFWCGNPDVSELPSAYENAAAVTRQIEGFGLAEIVDRVLPVGAIMAGDWERDAPWRRKRAAKDGGNV